MKKIAILSFTLFAFSVTSTFAQDVKAKEDKVKIKDKGDKMGGISTGNYKATYSSNFQIGNAAHVAKVMDIWQDWDDNKLDRHDYFADTLTMYFPDGTSMKGKTENLEAAKKYRGGLTAVTTILHAVVPLRNDRNEDVVAIWGQEVNTHPDGKIEKKNLHEVWFFNKDGRISDMRQFQALVK